MNLFIPHRFLSCLLALGLFLLASACGEPAEEEETSNNANSSDGNNSSTSNNVSDSNNAIGNNTVFNNASVETPCVEKLTQEECRDQAEEVTGCGWYGAMEWTWEDETCHQQRMGVCIKGSERSPGDGITIWRLKEDGTPQVFQLGSIPQFEDDTWEDCARSADPPPACACKDPNF